MNEQSVRESVGVISPLLVDVMSTSFDLMEKPDAQHRRRNFVRCVFAALEGLTYEIRKRMADEADQRGGLDVFTVAELVALRDQAFRIGEDGRPKESDLYNKSLNVVVFTANMLAKWSHGMTPEYDRQHKNHARLSRAFTIRNNITHPKEAAKLDLSDTDVATVAHAGLYYIAKLHTAYTVALAHRFEQANEDKPEMTPEVRQMVAKINKHLAEAAEYLKEAYCDANPVLEHFKLR